MSSPLEAYGQSVARIRVKVFTADNGIELENEVNEFIKDMRANLIVDIKYAADMLEAGVILYSAMVIYQINEK